MISKKICGMLTSTACKGVSSFCGGLFSTGLKVIKNPKRGLAVI